MERMLGEHAHKRSDRPETLLSQLVTAPSEADETCRAYLAMTRGE